MKCIRSSPLNIIYSSPFCRAKCDNVIRYVAYCQCNIYLLSNKNFLIFLYNIKFLSYPLIFLLKMNFFLNDENKTFPRSVDLIWLQLLFLVYSIISIRVICIS
jgi:hypothetical protein